MSKLPLFKEFITYLKKNKYSEETVYNYKRDLEAFGNFLNKTDIKFQEVTNQTIANYKSYLTSIERKTVKNQKSVQVLSSFSINRMLSSLRLYLKYLINIGYKSPISPEIIKLIKSKQRQLQNITLKDQIKLIEAPTKFEKNKVVVLRNRAMLETIFSTGIRISELINLKKNQIDKSGRIFIRGQGKRFVYLTPRAQKHLKNYLKVRGESDSPYLFIPYRGKNMQQRDKKISPNYLQERIKRYRESLGINIPLSAHSIRHAFATYLAESGASPVAIQILLGHESLDTTTRYVHASDRFAERVFRKFHPLKE
jgi:site-specific recombinase XerD